MTGDLGFIWIIKNRKRIPERKKKMKHFLVSILLGCLVLTSYSSLYGKSPAFSEGVFFVS